MGQKSRWTLPQTVHPDGYRRFVVCVPDERFYIAAFQGLLIELTYSKNWQRDSAHTAAEVSRIWQDVLANVTCEQDCTITIDEMDYDMSICEQLRFHNGKLQGYCCGEWVDIAGQPSQGVDGPSQPGGGTEQPEAGGGCVTYQGKVRASETWLLPTVVNTGDTIAFSAVDGAGSDGTLHWYCNDGQVFFAGLCAGQKSTSGSDPAPALSHMALVLKIGSTYYDISAGTITVPAGITNEVATLQVNDVSLSGNSGDYKFSVTVCNNQPATWSHVFDLTLQNLLTIFYDATYAAVPVGTWTPGTGYAAVSMTTVASGNLYKYLRTYKQWATQTTLKSISIRYDETVGSNTAGGSLGDYIYWRNNAGASTTLTSVAAANGTGKILTWSGSQLAYGLGIDLWVGDNNPGGGDPGGAARLYQLTVTGTGFDPFA